MTGKEYQQLVDGDRFTIEPKQETLQLQCCDCGLTHDIQFRITSHGNIIMRMFLNRLETIKKRKELRNA
jgi:hypothetical protein